RLRHLQRPQIRPRRRRQHPFSAIRSRQCLQRRPHFLHALRARETVGPALPDTHLIAYGDFMFKATRLFCASILFAIALLPMSASANHGPGTSGGGSSTASGETLKQGKSEVGFRLDYTQFEDISRTEAARIAQRTGDFDSLSDSVVATIEAAYGLTDDFQLSGQVGYYWGSGFLAATSQ